MKINLLVISLMFSHILIAGPGGGGGSRPSMGNFRLNNISSNDSQSFYTFSSQDILDIELKNGEVFDNLQLLETPSVAQAKNGYFKISKKHPRVQNINFEKFGIIPFIE